LPAHRNGDQRSLAFAPIAAAPAQFLAAWDDLGMSFGAGEGQGDVVLLRLPPVGSRPRSHDLDVNGDGYADQIVGAPGKTTNDTGKALVYLGSPGGYGPTPQPSFTLSGGYGPGGGFGYSVANAGDVNHDGYVDVIVGEPARDAMGDTATQGDGTGRAYLFFGGPLGLGPAPVPAVTLVSPDGPSTGFGYVVRGVGDVDGDGYGDVAVGAPYYAQGGSAQTGRVYVYRGAAASGMSRTPAQILTGFDLAYGGTTYDGFFGIALAGAGDVNGDGFADIAVGAPGVGGGVGRAYVYLGGPGGLASPPVSLSAPPGSVNFGTYVAGAGDLNRDGLDDVVASGTYGFAVYVGTASGASQQTYVSTFPDPSLHSFGVVAGLGDVNGDGYDDVGAWAIGGSFTGPVLVYHGGPSGIGAAPGVQMMSGWSLTFAGAGDADGDGLADVILGRPSDTAGVSGGLYFPAAAGLGGSPASLMSSTAVSWLGGSVAGANP
jgi:hypothetical protein